MFTCSPFIPVPFITPPSGTAVLRYRTLGLAKQPPAQCRLQSSGRTPRNRWSPCGPSRCCTGPHRRWHQGWTRHPRASWDQGSQHTVFFYRHPKITCPNIYIYIYIHNCIYGDYLIHRNQKKSPKVTIITFLAGLYFSLGFSTSLCTKSFWFWYKYLSLW